MIKEIIFNWALRNSEKEIARFLSLFSQGDAEQNGAVVGLAALLHHQCAQQDPEFNTLLNSTTGSNHGPLGTYVMELDWLLRDLHRVGRINEVAAMKLWNITFRCMTHETFHHYGVSLWEIASISFPFAKLWLKTKWATAESAANKRDAMNLEAALTLYDFVPPQFSRARTMHRA